MKILIFSVIIVLFGLKEDPLIGRWESAPSVKGNVTGVVFKSDATLEAYVNKKAFASGTYSFNAADSIVSFVDNGCNGARGIYKILFFNNSDSFKVKAISDSCTERKNGMEALTLGRVKK